MLYYVRQERNATIEGPFSIDDLKSGLAADAIAPHSLASSDIGDGPEALRKFRRCDWFPLSEIPNLQNFYPPPNRKEVDIAQHPSWRRQTLSLLLTAMLIYSTATQQSWWAWAFAFAALVQVVGLILQRNRTIG